MFCGLIEDMLYYGCRKRCLFLIFEEFIRRYVLCVCRKEYMKVERRIFVTRSSMPSMDEYIEEIKDLWDSHWLTNMGEKHKHLQSSLCEYLKVTNVELLTNGHMALELAMQAMKLQGEVITTPFTFASTIHAIVRSGLTPVFCDINIDDFTIDVNQIESLITERTCAILPVHVYGNICDVEKIDRIAKKHNLKVIYDAAHAFGELYKGRGIGTFGDAACFSFHATKVFNTIEGGAVCFQDSEFGHELYSLKNFGIRNEEIVDNVGTNAKLNEFQAAMGICNLRHIDKEINKRKRIYQQYCERLKNISGIRLNTLQRNVDANYSYFPIIVEAESDCGGRDELYEKLKRKGIYSRKYFYPIASEYECYKNIYSAKQTPNALDISRKVLTLPLYADLSLDEVDYICDCIIESKNI